MTRLLQLNDTSDLLAVWVVDNGLCPVPMIPRFEEEPPWASGNNSTPIGYPTGRTHSPLLNLEGRAGSAAWHTPHPLKIQLILVIAVVSVTLIGTFPV